MKKKKFITLLLSLSFICTLIFPVVTTKAQNGEGGDPSTDGMVISKTAIDNGNGTYTITLEAFATGETIISEIAEDVPLDIILVLDQSDSMNFSIGTVSFNAYSSSESTNILHYDRRHNGGTSNLWHKLSNNSYVPVSVDRQVVITGYQQLSTSLTNYDYYYYADRLYEKVGEEYKKVNLSRRQYYNYYTYSYYYVYTYDFSDGTRINSYYSTGYPNLGARAPLYAATTAYEYTYTYTNGGGVTQTIGTSTGSNTQFVTPLYRRTVNSNSGISRLQALKNAVTTFVNSVATKAAGADGSIGTADDVNHRIAMVGFASGNYRPEEGVYYHYLNTEIFIGATEYRYGTAAQSVYGTAFQSMDTQVGQDNITASIGALDGDGGTLVHLGMEMANGILDANPIPQNEERKRVIIVFTDGTPGWSGYDANMAASAINQGDLVRSKNATVYTVGIFAGADANSPGSNASGATTSQKANWFMQNLSCNQGTPQDPSFYLSADDAESLNNVFQQLVEQIVTERCGTTLNEYAVIKDVISQSFTLPQGVLESDITLETYACTGMNGQEYIWSKNNDAMGATVDISEDRTQLSVTGFDFSGNYVGTITENGNVTYRGNKLVIKFDVIPRPGFLGGNQVKTNASAGIYENINATDPVLVFEDPIVDVAIPAIEITVPSGAKDIYLLQGIPLEDISEGVAVKIGTVNFNLDPNAVNWGLEAWQNEYIDVVITYIDANGNPIPAEGLQNISADTSYSVTVTVEPKYTGTVSGTGVTQTGSVTINVFKPELTFKDGSVYYGAAAPTDAEYASNLTGTLWKHNGVEANETEMGAAPVLTLTYTPESSKIVDGKIAAKDDIKVNTIVKIGDVDITDKTVFLHTPCNPPCDWNENILDGSPAFLLHVKTCALTVVKTGGAENESYVFEVKKDGVKYTELTIWGNGSKTLVELPVGNYTIEENTGWSWRYNADNGGTIILSAANPEGSITCTNSSNGKDNWLNGFSEIVQNIYNAIN